MRFLRKLLAAAASAAIAASALTFPTSAASSARAKQIVSDMGIGWNLGNTFDSINAKVTKELDFETAWGNPETTKALIDKVASLGFSSIRIPVSWHPHVDGNLNISSAWINRVKTVVDWAVSDGLYVIVNIHHDNDIRSGNTNYFYPSSAHLNVSKNYVTKIWKQVSEKFKNYDEHLIFETLNEPRLTGHSNEWWFNSANPGNDVNDAIKCINTLNQAAVDTIRATGGNNKTRLIMCPGYDASIDGATVSGFKLPSDSANTLAVSVHGYTPYEFAGDKNGTAAYSRSVQSGVTGLFSKLNTAFISKGIPVVIGEFGATDKNNSDARSKWASDYTSKAAALGISCVVWDNGGFRPSGSSDYNEKYGIINRRTLAIADQAYCNALLSTVKKKSIKDASVTVKYPSYTYTGKAITPDNRNGANEFTVKDGSKTLTKGTDYTVSYKNNVNVGVATATVTGKGKYSGSKSIQFIVKPAKNSVTSLTTEANKITVKWNEDKTATGYQVLYSTDSTFGSYHSTTVQNRTYVNLTSVPKTGERYYIKVRSFFTKDGKVTSTRYGNYSDVQNIVVGSKKVLGSASLKYGSYTYTGSAVTPDSRNGADELTVKDISGKKLTKNVDYTVTYKGNKAVGTANISIKGKGSYSGCVNKQFVIKPAVNAITSISSDTSGAFRITWKKGTSGTVGYQVKYSTDKNFVNNVHSYTSTNLSDLSENFSSVPNSGETWYVKVRSFYTKDGSVTATRYGNYSAVKSIRVK